ncbi:50S ribosomal protein L3 [bacterium CPR1]|nr:50S ribosomal protein L3 [bacterium CPR1]
MKAILGKKIGMTQVFDENGLIVPVTVVEAGPCIVVRRRTKSKDGYEAVQVGYALIREKLLNKPEKGQFRPKKGDANQPNLPNLRYLREFRVDESNTLKRGDEIRVEMFEAGEKVDVTAISKGKGFQGTMKRHRFGGGPRSHGSMTHRQPCSGGGTDPARVFVGTRKPGHMGDVQVTQLGLRVVKVDAEKNLILIRGAIPGPNNRLVTVRAAVKSGKK